MKRYALVEKSKALNTINVKFYCGEGNKGGRFSECLQLNTAYLSTKIEGGGDVKMLIQNGKMVELAWPNPVVPNTEATKAMLQAEYKTHARRVEKLWVNLSTVYGLVLGKCTNYLRSNLDSDHKLLALISSVKLLAQKYDEDTEFYHMEYHTFFHRFVLFRQGESSNVEYK